MADIICCDQTNTTTTTTTSSSSSCGDHHHHHHHHQRIRSRSSRMDHNIRNSSSMFKFVPDHHHVVAESSSSSSSSSVLVPVPVPALMKRQKLDMIISTTAQSILLKPCLDDDHSNDESSMKKKIDDSLISLGAPVIVEHEKLDQCPKFSTTSVCGRRREMEDAVAIHPSFWRKEDAGQRFHFFGVYDGHGCSHVAKHCKKRLHHLVREELEKFNNSNHREDHQEYWKEVMERSFDRMDKEVLRRNIAGIQSLTSCKCELQMPQCDAVGSTAVVFIVTPDKVVVANCGDSRAILCRDGKAVPLSVDHKPDLPEELNRIEEAGGRVIYWDGARVLGVLAMSRAIGDNYLKPYVSSVPEITMTERSEEDEFLIMASDGLWDVVSNETACDIVKMCLNGNSPIMPEKSSPSPAKDGGKMFGEEKKDKGCSDAVMLLTKLALARGSGDNVSVVVVDLRREKKKKN